MATWKRVAFSYLSGPARITDSSQYEKRKTMQEDFWKEKNDLMNHSATSSRRNLEG
jgi:hypothetical protein